ncbi:uncharacterized protein TRIREDRAFT_111393 [Trichoderma reesei QM6a]|uniref:Predicted protein n=2 Tax=Hypocrea jecorina TaxID=51453 RepID=G0RUG1_HYPJQ|nr:uncharacterized protein TRIREDRAFT_111393 [Trichoderma reesei QM6a]EGR45189.1 predicted protein [Trichoderma reesei QM6a]ETR98324.1 hypothetical protein M419DRAFT_89259 [Trichoderma reesei RUT C-30]
MPEYVRELAEISVKKSVDMGSPSVTETMALPKTQSEVGKEITAWQKGYDCEAEKDKPVQKSNRSVPYIGIRRGFMSAIALPTIPLWFICLSLRSPTVKCSSFLEHSYGEPQPEFFRYFVINSVHVQFTLSTHFAIFWHIWAHSSSSILSKRKIKVCRSMTPKSDCPPLRRYHVNTGDAAAKSRNRFSTTHNFVVHYASARRQILSDIYKGGLATRLHLGEERGGGEDGDTAKCRRRQSTSIVGHLRLRERRT